MESTSTTRAKSTRYLPPFPQPNPATDYAIRDFGMSFRWYRIGMEGDEMMHTAIAHALESASYPFGMNVDEIEIYL